MNWIDVTGAPGVGKSTICDPLWHSQLRLDDGKLPPADWAPFIDAVTKLLDVLHPYGPELYVPALRMNLRSIKKMATVARTVGDEPYIQTGLVQRGLGFGWRLNMLGRDLNLIRPFFETMPVSLGVAVLTASRETIIARNHARKANPATAHEDRAFMVPLMEKPREIALEVLRDRGVAVVTIDTEQSVDQARAALVAFAAEQARHAPALRSGGEGAVLPVPPPWWQ